LSPWSPRRSSRRRSSTAATRTTPTGRLSARQRAAQHSPRGGEAPPGKSPTPSRPGRCGPRAGVGAAGGWRGGRRAAPGDAARGAVDAVAPDAFGRAASARGTIEQAIADMRVTDGLAARTSEQMKLPLAKAVDAPGDIVLEVGVSELELLAHKTEMALVLRGRSRLVRSSDGRVLEEHEAETRTEFRKYQDWAADGGQPLRDA